MPAPQPSAPGPFRFAHPFFTDIPPERRPPSPRFGRRMLDHIENRLEPVPKPKDDSVMLLSDIIGKQGSDEIAKAGRIQFHATGDTGRRADSPQGEVAEAQRSLGRCAAVPFLQMAGPTDPASETASRA